MTNIEERAAKILKSQKPIYRISQKVYPEDVILEVVEYARRTGRRSFEPHWEGEDFARIRAHRSEYNTLIRVANAAAKASK